MAESILNPKRQFQEYHTKESDEWRINSRLASTKMAMLHAYAEFSNLGFSQPEVNGARQFIFLLLNLSEPEPPPLSERYPAQPLQDVPTTPVPEMKET